MGPHREEDDNPFGLHPAALYSSSQSWRPGSTDVISFKTTEVQKYQIICPNSYSKSVELRREPRASGSKCSLPFASGFNETGPELRAFYSILAGLYKNTLCRKINSSCLPCGGLDSLELKSSQSWGAAGQLLTEDCGTLLPFRRCQQNALVRSLGAAGSVGLGEFVSVLGW